MTGSPLLRLRGRPAWVLLAVYWPAIVYLTHMPPVEVDTTGLVTLAPDKLIHFAFFAMLTLLLWLARPLGRQAPELGQAGFAAAVAVAYCFIDEYTQQWVGRTFDPQDIAANLVGIVAAFVAVLPPTTRVVTARVGSAAFFAALLAVALIPGVGINHLPVPLLADLGITTTMTADKPAHALAAMLMFAIINTGRWLGRKRPLAGTVIAVAVTAAAGVGIEALQELTDRRSDIGDMVAHFVGLAVAIVLWLVWPRSRANALSQSSQTDGDAQFVSHARTVGGLTLLSRFTGLGRDAYLTSTFGLTGVADAFWFGFALPNLFRRLFGEGALTAAFIPVYTDLLQRDPTAARRFMTVCVGLTLIVLSTLTLIGEAVLYALLTRSGWSVDSELAIRLSMLMLPYMPMVCLVAVFGAVLQVHGRFAPAAGMPILLNVVMILGTAFASAGAGTAEGLPLRYIVTIVAVFVLVAGVLQVGTQLLMLLSHESFTRQFHGVGPHLRLFWRSFVPTFLALSVFQLNTFFDQMLAMGLSTKAGGGDTFRFLGYVIAYPIEAGGLAALNAAQRLYQFPLGVFGIAIATAIFPALARAAAGTEPEAPARFRVMLQQGLRVTLFIGLPASVGLMLVGLPLARLLFERGQFELDDARRVAAVLFGYAPAIWAYSMTHVLTRGFYAVKDARTPMLLSIVIVALNLLLNLLLVWPLGAAGLAWSTAICAALQCGLLLMLIRRHVDQPIDRSVLRGWGTTLGLTVFMAAVLVPPLLLADAAELSLLQLAGYTAMLVVGGAAAYTVPAWILGIDELRWLLRRRA